MCWFCCYCGLSPAFYKPFSSMCVFGLNCIENVSCLFNDNNNNNTINNEINSSYRRYWQLNKRKTTISIWRVLFRLSSCHISLLVWFIACDQDSKICDCVNTEKKRWFIYIVALLMYVVGMQSILEWRTTYHVNNVDLLWLFDTMDKLTKPMLYVFTIRTMRVSLNSKQNDPLSFCQKGVVWVCSTWMWCKDLM